MSADPVVDEPEAVVELPEPEPTAPTVPVGDRRVLALWLPMPARRRLIDADLDIVEDLADGPNVILASTRGPAARRSSIRSVAASAPVVVVCHPGGEAIAAEMVTMGAVGIVAEGSESSALRVLDGEGSEHLVAAYLSEVDRNWSGGSAMSVDPVTGFTASSGFELRLAELGKDGGMPRLGIIELGLEQATRQIGPSGGSAVKRRLAMAIAGAVGHRGAELFDLGERLSVLAPNMASSAAVSLGAEIVAIGATFAPTGEPLQVAVGWAGPEAASDVATLRLLAERALEVASSREERVVDAEELSQHSAATIELNAAIGVADAVDALDPRGPHSVRVAEYATDLARELQLDPQEVAEIGLAARLHDVGKAGFGADAFEPDSSRFEEARESHPQRGAAFVLPGAGPVVAAVIRSHHEHWDGSGFPDALTGNDIPLGARILAVAHRYDDLASSGSPQSLIEERLRSEAGGSLDPDLVEGAISLFGRG